MRIGVNCFMLMPHVGGLKQYFSNLFDYLLEDDPDNVYVFFHFSQNKEELSQLRSTRWRQNASYLEQQEDISKHFHEIDLYFCPFGFLWPRPAPIPTVVTLVDIQEVSLPQFFSSADRLDRAYHFPGSTRAADRVVTISQFSKDSICRAHAIPEHKVVVSHLCADERYFQAERIARAPEPPIPFDRYLFYPANRWLHKNHDGLLRAMRILKDRGLDVNAVFTGYDVPGAGYPLVKKAREYGLESQVHVAGYVPVDSMAYLYRNARMLLFPSLYEGFGIPATEAMAAGCPMAVSDRTSLPEICEDAAVYFDPTSGPSIAKAIRQLWHDGPTRDTFVERGRRRAIDFSAERMGDAHRRAFREARETYSPLRYRWHRHVYQRYHWYNVHLRHWASVRLQNGVPPGVCSVLFSGGWHHREHSGTHSFRWTNGNSRLVLHAPREMKLVVTAEVASAVLPNTIDVVWDRKVVGRWTVDGDGPMFRSVAPVSLTLRPGRNVLTFVSSKPPVSSASDPRKLAVAFQDLTLRDLNGEIDCVFRN